MRISITDRCNLRCRYCMPEGSFHFIDHNQILRFEEIIDFVKVAIKFGITKIRITGGEPLVRKGVVDFIAMLSQLEGLEDLSMTTNGILLKKYAKDLFNAGLKRINISLDTLNAEKFCKITRGGNIENVLNGIFEAKQIGFNPIKINCVLFPNHNASELEEIKDFCQKNGFMLRFIQEMNLENGNFSVVQGGTGGDCKICNRIRLTSNGYLKPCLFSDIQYSIKTLGYENALKAAIGSKPAKGTINHNNLFNNIGG